MSDRRDMWNDCYAGDHARNMSPESFRFQFCSRCGNSRCTNSASGQTRWQRRIETQEDILLNNPQFADPNDPRYREVRELDFPDLLRKAMKLEISSQRGDWEPVTETQAMEYVADLSKPAGFQDEPELPEVKVVRQEQVRGSGGNQYVVSIGEYEGNQVWDCTCPAFEYQKVDINGMCPHIRTVLGLPDPKSPTKLPPPERELPPTPTRTTDRDERPSPEKWRQASERNRIPKMKNTRYPSEGMMVDGSPAPAPPEPVDPWAPKPQVKGTVVKVGGKIVLGGSKEEK